MSISICSETGGGKTASVSSYLQDLSPDIQHCHLRFYSRTKSYALQSLLEKNLTKHRRLCLGPSADITRLVACLDDVNIPEPDKYGSQQAVEFLRQLMDGKGFHDVETLNYKTIQDVSFILMSSPPHGGRPKLSPRSVSLSPLSLSLSRSRYCRFFFPFVSGMTLSSAALS